MKIRSTNLKWEQKQNDINVHQFLNHNLLSTSATLELFKYYINRFLTPHPLLIYKTVKRGRFSLLGKFTIYHFFILTAPLTNLGKTTKLRTTRQTLFLQLNYV